MPRLEENHAYNVFHCEYPYYLCLFREYKREMTNLKRDASFLCFGGYKDMTQEKFLPCILKIICSSYDCLSLKHSFYRCSSLSVAETTILFTPL